MRDGGAASEASRMESADPNAWNRGVLTPMRCSAVAFLVPLAVALRQRRTLGSVVIAVVTLSSIATHRPRTAWTRGTREAADLVAIGAWCLYNTTLVADAMRGLRDPHGSTAQRAMALATALGCAVACIVLDAARNRHVYRSARRDALHVSLHLTGALGTLAVLEAARR